MIRVLSGLCMDAVACYAISIGINMNRVKILSVDKEIKRE